MRPDAQAPEPLLASQEVDDLLKISPKTVREYIHQGHIKAIDIKSDGKHPIQAVSVQDLKGNRLAPTSFHSQVMQNLAVRVDLTFKAFFHLYITHQQHSNPVVRSCQYRSKVAGLIRAPLRTCTKKRPGDRLRSNQVILRRGSVTGGRANAAL